VNPYYKDKWVTIYHGDCREILPSLDVKVDLVLTDIPYNISQKSAGLRNLDYGEWDKQAGTEREWFDAFVGKSKQSVIVFCHKTQFSDLIKWLILLGFSTRTLIWHKPNPTIINCDKLYIEATELMAYGKLPKAIYNPDYKHNIFEYTSPVDRQHPTQKPIELLQELILDTTANNNTVLDPFFGSGTTLFAAKKLNRYSIGIEIEERYCEISAKRCSQEVMELSL
jgi:site-specific DNA-methyltransferase (adenine-specific)